MAQAGQAQGAAPAAPHAPRLTLPEFNGQSGETAQVWYQRFNLLSTRYNWTDQEKVIQLGFHCVATAGTWFATLPPATRNGWNLLRPAFEAMFLNTEPPLVTESKLQSRVLQPNESIDSYYSSILSLGAALGRQPDNLATNFLNGLPESYRDFVAGTDNHVISNYVDRARLFHARHPNKTVQFENQFAITDHTALKTDIVNAVAEQLKQFSLEQASSRPRERSRERTWRSRDSSPSGSRSRTPESNERSRSYSRPPRRSRGRSYRGSYSSRNNFAQRQQRHFSDSRLVNYGQYPQESYGQPSYSYGNYNQSGNSADNNACFRCGQQGHWARQCPNY